MRTPKAQTTGQTLRRSTQRCLILGTMLLVGQMLGAVLLYVQQHRERARCVDRGWQFCQNPDEELLRTGLLLGWSMPQPDEDLSDVRLKLGHLANLTTPKRDPEPFAPSPQMFRATAPASPDLLRDDHAASRRPLQAQLQHSAPLLPVLVCAPKTSPPA